MCRFRSRLAEVMRKPLLAFLLVAAAAAVQEEPSRLSPGDVRKLAMAGGGSHRYILPLLAGEFLGAVADQQGIDVEITLSGPDGRVMAHSDLDNIDRSEERRVGKECRSRW